MWRSTSTTVGIRRRYWRRLEQKRIISMVDRVDSVRVYSSAAQQLTAFSERNSLPIVRSRLHSPWTQQHPFSSITDNNTGNNSSGAGKRDEADDEDDEEAWVPPVRTAAADDEGTASSTSPIPKSERIETLLEVSRQIKERERLDRALEEAQHEADALFQLSEEEQATLTDEEILERLERVLEREQELEEALVQRELEREQKALRKQREAEAAALLEEQPQAAPDWLQNRREKLTQESSSGVPVLHHQLLTADEIQKLLEAHGGTDVVVLPDDPEAPRMGGADGMIVCTGGGSGSGSSVGFLHQSPHLISTLSRVLIDHMKDRKLDELGTAPGAEQNSTHRGSHGLYDADASWKVVDCGSYIVHILDAATRWDLNLEDLWSGEDPLWKLNVFDEEAIEDYCERFPVPETYPASGRRGWDEPDTDEAGMDGAALKKLERTRFGHSRRHKPVVPYALRNQHRRVGRRKRREEREQHYSGGYDE